MKQFLITVLGVLIGMVLFFVVAPIVIISMISSSVSQAPRNPDAMVLSLDLRQELPDQPVGAGFSFGSSPSLLDLITQIQGASEDDRVRGIYIRANTSGLPGAQAEELSAALRAFRDSGKFAIASIQNDSVRTSMAGYLVASAADEVWLHEAGEMMPMGLAAEVDFFGATLQRFRIQAQVEAREDFKTAANIFTEEGFTDAHRAELQGLLDGIYGSLVDAIAANRNMTADAVRAAVEATPFTAERARELGLVDQLGRPEDAERAALDRAGGNAQLVDIAEYTPRAHSGGPVIAVVQGEGEIVTGPADDSPFAPTLMTGDAVARALLDAAEDEDVRAIVFRVSSPGGSVVASDQILNALRIARESGKKVVVSMGPVAASGGYYVSAQADEIIASPTTITGSIGVVGAKIAIGDALDHYLSVRSDTLEVGSPLSDWFTSQRPFNQAERAAFAAFIDRAYADFLALVAEGRNLTPEQARAVAQGRAWTGAQALELRLVDHLGGFTTAIARAKALAGIEEDQRVQLRYFPERLTPVQQLQRLLSGSEESMQGAAMLGAIASNPRLQRAITTLAVQRDGARAEAAPVEVR